MSANTSGRPLAGASAATPIRLHRMARCLLAEYPAAGLTSAAALAATAGTSTPTVLRFAARLGVGGYRDFQRHLRDEITHESNSPAIRAGHAQPGRSPDDVLGAAIAQRLALG